MRIDHGISYLPLYLDSSRKAFLLTPLCNEWYKITQGEISYTDGCNLCGSPFVDHLAFSLTIRIKASHHFLMMCIELENVTILRQIDDSMNKKPFQEEYSACQTKEDKCNTGCDRGLLIVSEVFKYISQVTFIRTASFI